MSTVHAIVPAGIDDPRRPSGGNVYDRRVCSGLATSGWDVNERPVAGPWPWPDAAALAGLDEALGEVPDRGLVMLDGLVASASPDMLDRHASRLRVVVLLHMPLGQSDAPARPAERAVLEAAAAVVAPSRWTRNWLLATYELCPSRVHVAEPGVDMADPAPGTAGGDRLLSVGAVSPHKGHDVLVSALARLGDVPWSCQVAGALDVTPEFAARLRRQVRREGIGGRMHLLGPLDRADLEDAYARSDVLVLASRAETYGMVVAEALAHGLPVITTSVGGVPEALGRAGDGSRPGLLVPSDNADALAAAVRRFLCEGRLRRRLRQAAMDRRGRLPLWSHTTARVAHVLTEAA